MNLTRIALLGAAGLALPATSAPAQSLPANPPTAPGAAAAPIAPLAATSPTSAAERHRAQVSYANGLLEIRADNSSLNQILRDISRQTGMTIVGGVADQRIFGTYGPAPAATILKTLLDGTGANMLLKETASHAPEQLILTPQTGGPIGSSSLPSPNSASFDATENEPGLGAVPRTNRTTPATAGSAAVPSRPQGALPSPNPTRVPEPGTALGPPAPGSLYPTMPAPMNNPNGSPNNVSPTAATLPVTNSVPTDSLPVPSTAQPATGIVDAPNPPPTGSTTQGFTGNTPPDNNPNHPASQGTNSPQNSTNSTSNGPKTPQQIYEELRRMEQQKQQGTQGGTTPPQP